MSARIVCSPEQGNTEYHEPIGTESSADELACRVCSSGGIERLLGDKGAGTAGDGSEDGEV